MIRNNAHKYSVPAMCIVLQIPRSTYYYEEKDKSDESEVVEAIVDIFKKSRNNYGTRKIKFDLKKRGYQVSRRRIGRIMKENGLVSNYTTGQFDEALEAFKIKRSLSKKGCPYDNAVSEATFKILKTEFVRNQRFRNLNELQCELSDYVNWFNHHRIHSSLGYQNPIQYKYNTLKNIV